MKKKILLGVIMVLAVMCMLVISISAVEFDGVHYTLDTKNQTAKVSKDNQASTTQIVKIPSTIEYDNQTYQVTSIEDSAFSGNTSIKELHILSEYITTIPNGMISNTYTNTNFTKIYIDFANIERIEKAGLNPSNTNGNNPESNKFYYYDLEGNRVTSFDFPNIEYIGFAAFQGANFDSIVLYLENELGTSNQSDGIPYSQTFRKSSATSILVKGDIEVIYNYQFQGMTNLKTIKIESTNLQKVGTNAFSGCTSVESISIDLSNCIQVGSDAFCFSGSKEIAQNTAIWYNLNEEKVVDISSVQKISARAFAGSNLGSARVLWPTNYSAENFGHASDSGAFRNANLKGMVYFDTAEGVSLFIDSYAFRGNQIETVIFGPGVTKVAGCFESVKTLKTVVFLADSVECTSSGLFKNCSGITFYHKGLTTNTSFSQATQVQISNGSLTACGACGVDCSVTLESDNSNVVISVPVHTWDEGAVNEGYCPIGAVVDFGCVYCTATKTEGEGTEHDHSVAVIVYENGFMKKGIKTFKCSNTECTSKLEETEETVEIFAFKGFSYSEVGTGSIISSFAVNHKALEAYNDSANEGEKITSYGLVAAVASNVTDGNPLAEGTKNATVEFFGKTYDLFEMKINGLLNFSQTPVYCTAYITVGNTNTFVDNGEIKEKVETSYTFEQIKAMFDNK